MNNYLLLILSAYFSLCACAQRTNESQIEKWKQEVLKTENDFSQLAQDSGIHRAFINYAADDAVLMRNDKLILGKKAIDSLYRNQTSTGLSWQPDHIDVGDSGDLAYTYGTYTFIQKDSLGESNISNGIFHTVWKRQSDGSWKFVWD